MKSALILFLLSQHATSISLESVRMCFLPASQPAFPGWGANGSWFTYRADCSGIHPSWVPKSAVYMQADASSWTKWPLWNHSHVRWETFKDTKSLLSHKLSYSVVYREKAYLSVCVNRWADWQADVHYSVVRDGRLCFLRVCLINTP